ncbi:putative oxidoreductase [Paenibacillus forsythiae]|uniref:Oxidoreductase n=1 Tax=Paenibacillus forsythiae TaxID=365616 RepID=A0ABU3H5I1_9BACL|nr:aldo/keto reductase [Paenibacillus forsythiae]MDT3425327.1 putative oxidoreductase [Paenibacillus forsythiae]
MLNIQLNGELSISKLVIGCMRMNDWKLSTEQVVEFIEWCIERGITTFDHADIYGGDHRNESQFGEALKLKPSLRENIQIVTKCDICVPNAKHPEIKTRFFNTDQAYVLAQVNESLEKLQCGYIDILLIHMFDLLVDPRELGETLQQLKSEGKVKYFGLSNHSPLEFDTLQKYTDMRFVTHQFMLHPLGIQNYHNGTMTHCLKEGISPMIWSPLAGGRIFKPTNAVEENMKSVLETIRQELGLTHIDEVVYQWIFKHSSNPAIVLGTGNKERIERAIQSAENVRLTREQWYKVLIEAGYTLW